MLLNICKCNNAVFAAPLPAPYQHYEKRINGDREGFNALTGNYRDIHHDKGFALILI